MTSTKLNKSDPKFILAYERGMLRSVFVSLFWAVIQERKKSGSFTFKALAKAISANKSEVSRWFRGDPNWTVNTIAGIANALDVDIRVEAIDRKTNAVFTPSGMMVSASTQFGSIQSSPSTTASPARPVFKDSTRINTEITRLAS